MRGVFCACKAGTFLSLVAQPREQRRVWFADGILPNGEVADAAKLTVSGTTSAGALAVSHDPSKPMSNSASPVEVRRSPPSLYNLLDSSNSILKECFRFCVR